MLAILRGDDDDDDDDFDDDDDDDAAAADDDDLDDSEEGDDDDVDSNLHWFTFTAVVLRQSLQLTFAYNCIGW